VPPAGTRAAGRSRTRAPTPPLTGADLMAPIIARRSCDATIRGYHQLPPRRPGTARDPFEYAARRLQSGTRPVNGEPRPGPSSIGTALGSYQHEVGAIAISHFRPAWLLG